jgi:hypothetical protein
MFLLVHYIPVFKGAGSMKTIQIDDATFSALWAKWQDGDQGENGILRRILGIAPPAKASSTEAPGFVDHRSGTAFARGFEIFRVFKGQHYVAIAEDGHWRLQDGRIAPSLMKLSALIGAASENAWSGWRYRDGASVKTINELRDQSTVAKRN